MRINFIKGVVSAANLTDSPTRFGGAIGPPLGTRVSFCGEANCEPDFDDMCSSLDPKTEEVPLKSLCVGWEQTGGCKHTGPLEANFNKGCSEVIESGASGRCVCTNRLVGFDCEARRPAFKCEDTCSVGSVLPNACEKIHITISRCQESDDDVKYSLATMFPSTSFQCEYPVAKGTDTTTISLDIPEYVSAYLVTCITRAGKTYVQSRRFHRKCPRTETNTITTHDSVKYYGYRDTLAYRDAVFSRSNNIDHAFTVHMPFDLPVSVDACFGGLAFYDMRTQSPRGSFRDCFYEAHDDNDCEHVSFSTCLVKYLGWSLFMNPRLTLMYKD